MELSRKERWQQLQAVFEPGFRRMLVISVLIHLLVPILYHTPFFPKGDPIKPPVYRVNLVNKPVKNPQAGRPEAVAAKPKPKAKPKPIPVKPKPIPPKPKPKPKPKAVPVKPKPIPKAAAKPTPKPAVSKAQETALQKRMADLRTKANKNKAEEDRKSTLDALRAAAAAESQQVKSPVLDAPVGMQDGKGDEAGVAAAAFVQEYIQQQWRLSKYQVSGNPQAEVNLVYSADGKLLHYRFIEKSGNSIFDGSLSTAINKSKQLNQPLPGKMDFQIVFNLKEMLDKR